MSNLHLVTGYAGQAHVTAADDGSFNTAIFGNGEYVFDIGSKFAASVVSNNKITIADGDLLMQGRHVRLNEGTTVALTINNGTQGKLRNDLIVARYTKDSVSGVEEVNLVVIQGTAADSNPADPAYTSGDIINDHALLNDMPLYRVPLNGLTVGTPVALFSLATIQISDGTVTTEKLASGLVVPIANGGTGATSAANALSNLKGISITKLWTNASPTSGFAPQTISLDLSSYQLVLVMASNGDGEEQSGRANKISAISPVGKDGVLTQASGSSDKSLRHRGYTAWVSGVEFYNGYINGSVYDTSVIPYQIYGIKGVV